MSITEVLVVDSPIEFTVDTSVSEVANDAIPAGGLVYVNAGGKSKLQPEDNFVLLSYGFTMDFCFTFGSGVPKADFLRKQGGAFYAIEEIDNNLWYPLQASEIDLNQFIPFRDDDVVGMDYSLEYELGIEGFVGNISMIGAPDSLDGQTMGIYPFVKIQHNLPLE